MANVDYIYVGEGPSLTDVMDAVEQIVGGVRHGEVLKPADERAALEVVDTRTEPGSLVLVYYAGDVDPRQQLARQVYDGLAEATRWDLKLDSDDAEDVIATRLASAAT